MPRFVSSWQNNKTNTTSQPRHRGCKDTGDAEGRNKYCDPQFYSSGDYGVDFYEEGREHKMKMKEERTEKERRAQCCKMDLKSYLTATGKWAIKSISECRRSRLNSIGHGVDKTMCFTVLPKSTLLKNILKKNKIRTKPWESLSSDTERARFLISIWIHFCEK